MPVDKFGRMSDTKTKNTGVSLTYINNNYVRSDGSTPLTGSLDMRFNKLVNLHKPTEQYDAATKDYVDYIEKEIREKLEKEIREKLEKRTHLIMVNANYTGPLLSYKFQFSFGGNEGKNSATGFLIPQSGRIKKIKMRTPINKESFNKRVIEKKKIKSDYGNGFFEFTKRKVDGNFQRIGAITCSEAYNLYEVNEDGKKLFLLYDFCFDDFLPLLDDELAEVKEGEIINIQTIINSELDFPPYPDESDEEYSGLKKELHIGNTYLVTFLIELDPL